MDGKKGMKQHNTSAGVHQGSPPLKKSLQGMCGKKGMKQHNTPSGVHQGSAPLGRKYIKSNKRKKILEASGYPICGFLRTSVNLNEAHKNIPQHKALLHFGGLVPDISSKDIGVPDENDIWSPICENFIEYQEETMYKFSDNLIHESQDLLKESLNICNYFEKGSFPNTAEELKNFMTWLDALEAHDLVDSNEELAHSNNELTSTNEHIMELNKNEQIKQNADLIKTNDENNSQFKQCIERCEELLKPSDKEINMNDLENERNSKFTHKKECVELLKPSDQVELDDEELNLNDDEVTKRSDEINGESTQHIETCEKLVEPKDEGHVKPNDIEVVDLSDDEVPEKSAKSNKKFAWHIEESKKRDERDREFIKNWVEKKTARLTQHRKDCEKICKPCDQVEPRNEKQVKSSDIEVVYLSDDEVSERSGESNEEFTQDIENSVKCKPSDVELSHNNMEEMEMSDKEITKRKEEGNKKYTQPEEFEPRDENLSLNDIVEMESSEKEIIKKNYERNSQFTHMKECDELLEPSDQVELGDENLNLNDVEEKELNADEVTKRSDESNGESSQHIETCGKLLEPRDEEQVKSNDIEIVDLSDDEIIERNDESDEECIEKSEKWKPSDEELNLNDIEEVEMSDKEVTKRNEESNEKYTLHEEFEPSYEKLGLNDTKEMEPSYKKIIKRNDERGGKFTQPMKECEKLLEPRDEEQVKSNVIEATDLSDDEVMEITDERDEEFTQSVNICCAERCVNFIDDLDKLLEPSDEETERSDEGLINSWYESKVKDFKLTQCMKECEKLLEPRDEEHVKSNDIKAADLSDDEVMEITDERDEDFTQSINICCAERCVT